MRKILSVVMSLVMLFAFTAVSFAAEQEAAPAPAAKTEKMEKTHHARKAGLHKISGEVAAVDATAGTITVKHKKGDVTISVDAKTKVKAGKEKKSIEDVKAGEKVTVKYKEEDGKKVATAVYIKTAKAAKKVKKAEKKQAAPMEKQEAPKDAPAAPSE